MKIMNAVALVLAESVLALPGKRPRYCRKLTRGVVDDIRQLPKTLNS